MYLIRNQQGLLHETQAAQGWDICASYLRNTSFHRYVSINGKPVTWVAICLRRLLIAPSWVDFVKWSGVERCTDFQTNDQ